jgi:aspartate/methionine/tyrosine aminotransferase
MSGRVIAESMNGLSGESAFQVLAAAMTRLLINSNSCTTHFVQHAGIAALEGPQSSVDARAHEFTRRRDFIVKLARTRHG